jgi:hypothetical protein
VACTTTVLSGCVGRTDANGWLQSASPTPAACDFTTMSNLAIAAASAAGYDTSITSTKFVYVVLPGGSGCGWAGLAYVGYGLAYSANVNALWVYGHELGHNFGLWHAGSVGCGAQVLGGGCSVSEYGDPFDVMGNIRQMHFNTKQKSVLNWIPSTSVKIHTSGTQTYQLSPLRLAVSRPMRSRFHQLHVADLLVEFRQPIGFDSPLSSAQPWGADSCGLALRIFDGSDDTEILDMTPGPVAASMTRRCCRGRPTSTASWRDDQQHQRDLWSLRSVDGLGGHGRQDQDGPVRWQVREALRSSAPASPLRPQ